MKTQMSTMRALGSMSSPRLRSDSFHHDCSPPNTQQATCNMFSSPSAGKCLMLPGCVQDSVTAPLLGASAGPLTSVGETTIMGRVLDFTHKMVCI